MNSLQHKTEMPFISFLKENFKHFLFLILNIFVFNVLDGHIVQNVVLLFYDDLMKVLKTYWAWNDQLGTNNFSSYFSC